MTEEGVCARFLTEMQDANAETVGSVGNDNVSQWETALAERYTNGSDVLPGALDKPGKGADNDGAP